MGFEVEETVEDDASVVELLVVEAGGPSRVRTSSKVVVSVPAVRVEVTVASTYCFAVRVTI